MRRRAFVIATAVLLGGPTVLAFFAGGYFDGARAAAVAVAWTLVLLLAVAGPSPLPTSTPGRLAIGGLVALAGWSAISLIWAPLVGPAVDNVQRLLLYVAALLVATAVLQDRRAARAVEPALALGSLVVIGYGLFERLLPGLAQQDGSFAAGGRLEQPITYWNAEGLLAAIGLVLCVRLVGDGTRGAPMRAAAAAASPVLGLGVYLSYSRGAIAAAVIGAILVLAAAPSWPQLRGAITCFAAGIVASMSAAALSGVASLSGTAGQLQRDGAIMLAVLVAVMVAAALFANRAAATEPRGPARLRPVLHAARLRVIAGVAVLICVGGLIVGGLLESSDRSERAGASPSRLASISSLRYEYWRVGVQAFGDHPALGVGSGGFRVFWRQHRHVNAGVTEVHSLVLEMGAELGVPGLIFLTTFLGGIAAAARRALRQAAPLAPAAFAGCTAWLLHASIDWDWQLPAVTLPALLLAGGLLAESERRPTPVTAPDDVAAEPEPPALVEEPPIGVGARLTLRLPGGRRRQVAG